MRGSATAEKGNTPGPDNMHDHGLGQKRFHEPPGLEQTYMHLLLCCSGAWIVVSAAAEVVPHQGKSGIIKERTDWSDEEHEPLDVADVPLERFDDKFFVHLICRDTGLGEIVEQVVCQDLHRRHRQEREQVASTDDAEHVAEVGTGPHAAVL